MRHVERRQDVESTFAASQGPVLCERDEGRVAVRAAARARHVLCCFVWSGWLSDGATGAGAGGLFAVAFMYE